MALSVARLKPINELLAELRGEDHVVASRAGRRERVHIGIHAVHYAYDGIDQNQVGFFPLLGLKENLHPCLDPGSLSRNVLVRTVPVIDLWSGDMAQFIERQKQDRPEAHLNFLVGMPLLLGEIQISILNRGSYSVAVTNFYKPKSLLDKAGETTQREGSNVRIAPGFGYAMEWISLSYLATKCVSMVRTSQSPSEKRIRQLERIGIPIMQEVPIKQWLAGLRRGFRMSVEKARASRANRNNQISYLI